MGVVEMVIGWGSFVFFRQIWGKHFMITWVKIQKGMYQGLIKDRVIFIIVRCLRKKWKLSSIFSTIAPDTYHPSPGQAKLHSVKVVNVLREFLEEEE